MRIAPVQIARRAPRRRLRRGGILLETILALAIIAIASAGAMTAIQERSRSMLTNVTGSQFATVTEAAERYLLDNYTQVHADLRAAAGPISIAPDELVAAGYLPTGWADAGPMRDNPYGHAYRIWVRRVIDSSYTNAPDTTAQPVPADNELVVGFDALVVSQGTETPDPQETAKAAVAAGKTAGYVHPDRHPGVARGLFGGWQVPVADFRPTGASNDPVHLAGLLPISSETACSRAFYRMEVPGCDDPATPEHEPTLGIELPTIFANSIDDTGQFDPDEAIGLRVDHQARVGGRVRVDGLAVVNSYLETTTPPVNLVGGSYDVQPPTLGNAYLFNVAGSGTFVLPEYVSVETTAGVVETMNSLTVVVQVDGAGVDENDIAFATCTNGSFDTTGAYNCAASSTSPSLLRWNFGTAQPPRNCTSDGDVMIYQFLRHKTDGTPGAWLGNLVWRSCA
jgi:type II secretory pathway pseudopilin PulG